MMKKEINVNEKSFDFFYLEDLNMWRTVESSNLLSSHNIDLEIDLNNLQKDIDWDEIGEFISYLNKNDERIKVCILDAQNILICLFQVIYKDAFSEEVRSNIAFNLSGIDYKGHCKIPNMEKRFEYDLFFFPFYTRDKFKDIGSFVYKANFRNNQLLGVFCDRV